MLEYVDRVFQACAEGGYPERTRCTRGRINRKQAIVTYLGKRRAWPKEAAAPQRLGSKGIAVLRGRMILVSRLIDLIAKLFHSSPTGAEIVALSNHRMRQDGFCDFIFFARLKLGLQLSKGRPDDADPIWSDRIRNECPSLVGVVCVGYLGLALQNVMVSV